MALAPKIASILQKRHVSAPALAGLPDVMGRIYAARGITSSNELGLKLGDLLPANTLKGLDAAINIINACIDNADSILVVGDFDADGATSTALMVLALRQMGAVVGFLVPDRFKFGYGLTPEIVALALCEYAPQLIITVDNGISSHDGVAAAQAAGVKVVITDHHLTSKKSPPADAVVNPNQAGCDFASKSLAGVGVAFYVLAALATLRLQQGKRTAKLIDYLDLVALGTVADVAQLDRNNRILVAHGVARIRTGKCRVGISALLDIAGRQYDSIQAQDLGFVLGPRINAAGRMDTMRIGIDCLLADNMEAAKLLAKQLDQLNRDRRHVEADMQQQALALLDTTYEQLQQPSRSIVLFQPSWHQGVIGIVAGRLKEHFNCPAVVFAPSDQSGTLLKGSARSINGIHIRDAIERVAEENAGLVSHFGGHAMAAGLTLLPDNFPAFAAAFEQVMGEVDAQVFESVVYTDGELTEDELSLSLANQLRLAGPWGQGFAEPLFEGVFTLISFKILKEKYLKLTLLHPDGINWLDGIAFNCDIQSWQEVNRQEVTQQEANAAVKKVRLAYTLDINYFNGGQKLQLLIKWLERM